MGALIFSFAEVLHREAQLLRKEVIDGADTLVASIAYEFVKPN